MDSTEKFCVVFYKNVEAFEADADSRALCVLGQWISGEEYLH